MIGNIANFTSGKKASCQYLKKDLLEDLSVGLDFVLLLEDLHHSLDRGQHVRPQLIDLGFKLHCRLAIILRHSFDLWAVSEPPLVRK